MLNSPSVALLPGHNSSPLKREKMLSKYGARKTITVRTLLAIFLDISMFGTMLKAASCVSEGVLGSKTFELRARGFRSTWWSWYLRKLKARPSSRSKQIICCKSQLGTCESLYVNLMFTARRVSLVKTRIRNVRASEQRGFTMRAPYFQLCLGRCRVLLPS